MSDRDDDAPRFVRLANGDLIDTSTGKRVPGTEINQAFADRAPGPTFAATKRRPAFAQGKRRYLDDLPLPPDQSRAVALVSAFTVFGLTAPDIAHIAKVDVGVIEQVQDSEAYAKFVDAMLQNIREHDLDKVRKKINDSALKAANKIVELTESVDEKVSLTAARDILDRASNRDAASSNGSSAGGLVIRIIDDRDNPGSKVNVDID